MIVPPDVIQTALMLIEQEAHTRGWDEPPRLILLTSHRFGDDDNVLQGRELPFARMLPDGINPAVALRSMADHFGDGHLLNHLAKELATPDFVGLAAITEAWGRAYDAPEQREEEKQARRRAFADMPGSKELRQVTACDTSGRMSAAIRERGSNPEFIGDSPRATLNGGRIPGALRDMVLAVALLMPFGTADLDAIRAVDLLYERG